MTVLDISATALGHAQQRLGPAAQRVRWLHADVLTWRPERRYRIWHGRALPLPDRSDRPTAVIGSDPSEIDELWTSRLEPFARRLAADRVPSGPPTLLTTTQRGH